MSAFGFDSVDDLPTSIGPDPLFEVAGNTFFNLSEDVGVFVEGVTGLTNDDFIF